MKTKTGTRIRLYKYPHITIPMGLFIAAVIIAGLVMFVEFP